MDHRCTGLGTLVGRWMLRALAGIAALILLMTVGAMTYQAVATASDQRRYPPPGELVDVGGYRLHIRCRGTGSPTVVLETGAGVPSLGWELVQPAVAQFTRVCAHDRAGYGWSDPAPSRRSGGQIVHELQTLLNAAGIDGPYVLVGHSLGGLYVRLYASQYPDNVAGLVLVDPAHEELTARLSPELRQLEAMTMRAARLAPTLARLGVIRIWIARRGAEFILGDVAQQLPPGVPEAFLAVMSQTKLYAAVQDELEHLAQLDGELRAAGGLPDIPVTVLSAGRLDVPAGAVLSAEGVAEAERLVRELHTGLARLSARGRFVVAENSGHGIPWEEPDLVVAAIRQVVEEVRQR